jgi:hypothetical protein
VRQRENLLDAAQFTGRVRDFDRMSWVADVEDAAARVRGCRSVVAPFGFEPIFAGSSHTIKPRRFYVYLTADGDTSRVERDLAQEIVRSALNEIRIVVTSSDTAVRGDGARGSLYVRTIGTGPETAMVRYARYMASLPMLVRSEKLREWRDYTDRPSARRYLMHTTIALVSLYPEIPSPSREELRLIAGLAREQRDRDPDTGAPPEQPARPEEVAALVDIIVPYLSRISDWLSGPEPGSFGVVDVHNGETSWVRVDEARLDTIAGRIEAHYRGTPHHP